MALSPRFLILVIVAALISLAFVMYFSQPGHAQAVYGPDDTKEAIAEASIATGLPYWWLYNTVACETRGTFRNDLIGAQGEVGAAQLHPYGELRTFYRRGWTDPTNPYQAITFMARRFLEGGSSAWSCA